MDSNQISILAVIVSFISAIVAFASYRVSKKALAVENVREARYLKSLSFELIKGLHINTKSEEMIYIFIVSINNSSSSSKSLLKVVLNVLYTDKQDFSRKAYFTHDPTIAKDYGLTDYEFAPLNTYLNPHETITLGFIFKVTKELIKDNYINLFKLVFEDNDNNSTSVDSILTAAYKIDTK